MNCDLPVSDAKILSVMVFFGMLVVGGLKDLCVT